MGKEKTTILVAESEIVEVQNASLKAEVARLDAEKRRLTTILAQHQPNCVKKRRLCTEEVPPTTTSGSQEEQYDMSHTFRRPAAPGNENSRGGSGTWSESRATQLRRLQYKPTRVPEEGGGRPGEPGTLHLQDGSQRLQVRRWRDVQ